MIEANTLIKKMGKEKFTDFVLKNKHGETAAERQRRRRFAGIIKSRMCEHGKWVIENYKPTENCSVCNVPNENKSAAIHVDSTEYFNIGTGTYGTTKEHRRYAKSIGLTEAG